MKVLTPRELASCITGAIVDKFIEIGWVSANNGPTGIVEPVATVARVKQSAPVAAINSTSARANVARIDAEKRRTVVNPVPAIMGDFQVSFSGPKDGRIKLPAGLFEGWARINLHLPTGRIIAVDEDAEGRGRLSAPEVAETGIKSGQTMVFDKIDDHGNYEVSVRGASVSTGRKVAPVARVADSLESIFAAPVAVPSVKTRSAKQLANDARLSARGKANPFGKGAPVSDALRANSPIYVAVPVTSAQKRVETARKVGHKAAATKQKAYAVPVSSYLKF